MSNISRDKLNKIGILSTEVTTIEEHSQCDDLGIPHHLQHKHRSLESAIRHAQQECLNNKGVIYILI